MNAVPALDWGALAPVVAVVVALLAVLVVDAVLPARVAAAARRLTLDGVTLAGLAAAAAGVVALGRRLTDRPDGPGGPVEVVGTLCLDGAPGQAAAGATGCAFVVSPLTLTLQGLVLALAVVCLLLALDGSGAQDRTAHHVLFLSAVAGALALAGARDLVTLLVALETASLPAVALAGLRRDGRGAQAAVTLLLTAVASLALLALGLGLLLLATGTLYLDGLAGTLAAWDAGPGAGPPAGVRAVAGLGVLLAVAGVAFKLSAVPFHLWTPDTYAGSPLPVAAFLSVVSKTAALAALLVLLVVGLPALAGAWAPALGALAVATMTVGNLVALRQRVAVRLLAWSTVAQAGWLLLPLAAVGPAGPAPGAATGLGGAGSRLGDAAGASVAYLVAYAAAGVTAFAVVTVLARHVADGEAHTLDAYRGLARREPVAAAVLGLALAALAGLPPGVVGLVAKLLAVRPVVDAGLWPLAVAAALNVTLALVYYLRWGALLVAAPAPGAPVPTWRVTPAEGLALGSGAATLVALSVLPQLLAGLGAGLLR